MRYGADLGRYVLCGVATVAGLLAPVVFLVSFIACCWGGVMLAGVFLWLVQLAVSLACQVGAILWRLYGGWWSWWSTVCLVR